MASRQGFGAFLLVPFMSLPLLHGTTTTRIPPVKPVLPPPNTRQYGLVPGPIPGGVNPGGAIHPTTALPATYGLQPLPPGFNPGGAEIPAYNQGGLMLGPSSGVQVPGFQPG